VIELYVVGGRAASNLTTFEACHGLAVAAVGSRIYAIAGGPQPGLTVTGANEHIDLA